MKVYAYVIALVGFIFIHTPAYALNNSLVTAMDLGGGGTVNDMLTYGDAGTTADDKPTAYYKFTLSSPSFITINVKSQSPTVNSSYWQVYLTNGSGTNVLYFAPYSNTADGLTRQIGLPAGTYSIEIFSNTYELPYQLTVNASQGEVYEQEPNDATTSATPVNFGTTYTGVIQDRSSGSDYDNYKFTLSSPTFITINVKAKSPTVNSSYWQVYLTNGSGTNVLYFAPYSNTADGLTRQIGLPAGTYSIEIFSNTYELPYQLTVNASQGEVYEQEPNDATTSATPVNFGTTYTGVIQDRSSGSDYDNYKFTLSSPTFITINVKAKSPTVNSSYLISSGLS